MSIIMGLLALLLIGGLLVIVMKGIALNLWIGKSLFATRGFTIAFATSLVSIPVGLYVPFEVTSINKYSDLTQSLLFALFTALVDFIIVLMMKRMLEKEVERKLSVLLLLGLLFGTNFIFYVCLPFILEAL